jgi:hypothetical protein
MGSSSKARFILGLATAIALGIIGVNQVISARNANDAGTTRATSAAGSATTPSDGQSGLSGGLWLHGKPARPLSSSCSAKNEKGGTCSTSCPTGQTAQCNDASGGNPPSCKCI